MNLGKLKLIKLWLIQTNLVTGSPAPLKARLERAEEVLEQTSVPQIDEQEAMQAVDAAQANAANFRTALQAALKTLREIEAERDGALTDAAAEQARATKHEERSKALRVLLGEEPAKAKEMWERFCDRLRGTGLRVAEGRFGAAEV